MNKIFSLIVFINSFFLASCYSQEQLIAILEKMKVEDQNIIVNNAIGISDNNYFEMMQEKRNFALPQYHNLVIYINTYKQYSIFIIVDDESFTIEKYRQEKKSKTTKYLYRDAILLDHDKKLCYLIKYGNTWGGMMLTYHYVEKNRIIRISDQFGNGINSIVRLDSSFRPMYGTILETYVIGGINKKDDEFVALFEFKYCGDTIYRNLLDIPSISIKTITDVELAKLFSDKHGYTKYIYSDCEVKDMKKIFEIGGMF